MWMLNNQTPFAAERTWVRDKDGAEVWLVAVKGTFDILADGTLMIADQQEVVVMAPQFTGDPQSSGLLSDTDLPHKKIATDVLVIGQAYAPQGKPVRQLMVSLNVGPIQKELRVIGDRIWRASVVGVSLSDPEPFTQMPITYERAYGGMDLTSDDPKQHNWERRNPAGCGFATQAKHLVDQLAHNIEDPKSPITDWKKRPNPAGFGPIAGHWVPRVELAGTYDAHWEKTRQPLLAEDFDDQYHQCAPLDQQVPGFLKGGEIVELLNMTPNGRLNFRLPRISLGLSTQFDDGTSAVHRAALHTVTIKPDFPRVVLVWHLHHQCHHKVLKLNSTSIRLKERIMLSERDNAQAMLV